MPNRFLPLYIIFALLLPGTALADIAGTITNGTGTGISGIEVNVYDQSFNLIDSGTTDSNGVYTIVAVPVGAYKIEFFAGTTGYANEWYDDQPTFYLADTVSVSDPGATLDIDAVLEPGGAITGNVSTSVGDGIGNITVNVYNSSSLEVASTVTLSSGTYTVNGLTPGGYTVQFYANTTGYVSQWYDGQLFSENANPVTVTAAQLTGDIDAVLVAGGSVSGVVTRNGGAGLSNISVQAFDGNKRFLASGLTDATGHYTIYGVPAGNVSVKFNAAYTDYVSEWYDNKSDFAGSDAVSVVASVDTSGINALLDLGGYISGNVTNSVGAGLAGIWVDVYDSSSQELVGGAQTDIDGDYFAAGLATGNYRVHIWGSAAGYLDEWYDDAVSFATATDIPVVVPDETPGIDILLKRPGSITGRVSRSGDIGLGNVAVSVYDANQVFYANALTDATGHYTVANVPPGNMKVRFDGALIDYKSEWFDDKADFAAADFVIVNEDTATSGIDTVLSRSTPVLTPVLFLLLHQ